MISTFELAEICGVSQGTVDRALHNRPGIAAATRERILAAAAQHGLLPNPAFREIMEGKSNVVGAVLPALHTPFFWNLLLALKEAFGAADIPFHAAPVADAAEFIDAVTEFAARRVQGLIMIPPQENITLPDTVAKAVNGVTLFTPLANGRTVFISPDEEACGRQAVEHLRSLGKKRIVHLTLDKDIPPVRGRAAGYTQAMQQAGLHPEILTGFTPDLVRKTIKQDKHTAFFCFNDWLALQVTRTIEQTAFSSKIDIAVMGVDADPTFTELVPGITSMAYPFERMAGAVRDHIVENRHPDQKKLQYTLRHGTPV